MRTTVQVGVGLWELAGKILRGPKVEDPSIGQAVVLLWDPTILGQLGATSPQPTTNVAARSCVKEEA